MTSVFLTAKENKTIGQIPNKNPFLLKILRIITLLAIALAPGALPGEANARRLESPSAIDLVADAMEVTQTIQDMNNSVPLIAARRTFVRVYAYSNGGTHQTTATLKVEGSGKVETVLPIKPGGPLVNVGTSYNRLFISRSFLFELPKWAVFSPSVTLTAAVNPDLRWRPRNPVESSYANNTITKVVSFTPTATLHLVIVDQPYSYNGTTHTILPQDRWGAVSWILRTYPLSQVKFFFRTLPVIEGQRKKDSNGNWDLVYPNCTWLNLYMAKNSLSLFGSPLIPTTATFMGLARDSIGFMRGCAPINGILTSAGYTRVASGPAGSGNWGWDFDGTYADWYSGHEIGHAWSRPHVRGGPGYVKDGCGGEAGAVMHNNDGRISPTVDFKDSFAIFGFDFLQLYQGSSPVITPYWSDVMTYCDFQWISKPTYTKLREMFMAYLPDKAPGSSGPQALQDVIGVFGSLDPATNQVTLQPVFTFTTTEEFRPPAPGPYAIVLRDPAGEELARYPFAPGTLHEGPAPYEGTEKEYAFIALLLPVTRNVAHLDVEGPGGVVLHQVEAGLGLPAVQVTSPNGGENFGSDPITVSWTASDPDSDPLTYKVEYSPDNGNSWETVAQLITGLQVTIDQLNLPASDLGLFRVTASDGLHTASDQSDGVFFIPDHPPSGQIITPASGATFASEQTVAFEAQVYDYDLGVLDGADLEWISDRDGLLGTGASFSTATLTEGLHEVSLFAGTVLVDQVIVTVVNTPEDLPPLPDALLTAPDPVFLFPTGGIPSATLYLDNLNLDGSISWEVASDMNWVNLSELAGRTPGEITVSSSLPPLSFGKHTAKLTFTDPNGLYDPVEVDVVVTIPEYDLFLPLVRR